MKYFIRSAKYFISLCVICIVLMAGMQMVGASAMSLEDTIYLMFNSDRYLTLFAAIVVLAIVYPKFGFMVRRVEGNVTTHREQIINAFRSAGFSLRGEAEGVMSFRADGLLQKLMLMWEDEIFVSQEGEAIRLEGIRRGVARVEYRLESYISMAKNG